MPKTLKTDYFITFLENPNKYDFKVSQGPKRTQAEWLFNGRPLVTHVVHWSNKHSNRIGLEYGAMLGLKEGELESGMDCNLSKPCLHFLLLVHQLVRQRAENASLFDKLMVEAPAILTAIRAGRGGSWNEHESQAVQKRQLDIQAIRRWPEAATIIATLDSLGL